MKVRTKIVVVIIGICLVGLMLMAWPLNLLYGDSYLDKASRDTTCVENELSEEDTVQQFFVAKDKKLKEVFLYLTDVGYENEGSLEVSVYSMDGTVLTEHQENLKDLKKNSYNRISLDCALQQQQEYYLQIRIHSGKNIGFMTVETQGGAADGSRELIYNGQQCNGYLAVDYQYQGEFNGIQTLMFWFICVLIYLAVIWLTFGIGWKSFFIKLRTRKNLWQFWSVMFVISLFNVAAFCSKTVTISRTFSVMWKIYLFWILTAVGFFYLFYSRKREEITEKKGIKDRIKDNVPVVILLFGAFLLRAPMLDTLQKWDAGEYYNSLASACENYAFTFESFWNNFRLCTHSNLGFSFFMAIGEFFSPRNSVAVLIVNLILTLLALYCLYELLHDYWLKCSKGIAAGITFVISCTPIFLGTFAYVNVDYMLALFAIFVIYAEYKEWHILTIFNAIVLSQVKETGAIVVAGYFGFKILLRFIQVKGNVFVRIKGCLAKMELWTAVIAGGVYAAGVIKLGSLSGWVQNTSATSFMSWSSEGINCFGIRPKYILYKLEQFFVMNFAWILTAVFLISIVLLIYDFRKGKKGNLDKYIGLIGALAGVVIFGSFYVTYTLERYNIFFAVGYTILVACVSYHAFKERVSRAITVPCAAVFGCAVLIQSYWSIDIVSEKVFGTVDIGNGNDMLFSCLDFEFYGDGLVCNYQYSWLDKAFDKLLRQVNYTEKTQILTTRKQSVGTQLGGNGTAYPISWDVLNGKRVLRKTQGTEYIGINAISMETAWGLLPYKYIEANTDYILMDRAVVYFIPYYQEDKEATLDILDDYYYLGKESSVTAYGGWIEYYNMIKKDNCAGISLGDLKQASAVFEDDREFDKELCTELVLAALEESGWTQAAVDDCLAYNESLYGTSSELTDTQRTKVEKYDIINMEVNAYDAQGKKFGVELIGNVTGNRYENVVVGNGRLLDGIEEALIGAELNETIKVECQVPEIYPLAGDKQGENITFEITPVGITGKWQAKERSESEAEKAYQDAEDNVWNKVCKKVEQEVLAQTVNLSMGAEDELNAYIAEMEGAYANYFKECGISKNNFLENYLQCEEEEYQELLTLAARAAMRKELVDEVLNEYKSNWKWGNEQ